MYHYDNFDLYIIEQDGNYRVSVNNPSVGQGAELVTLPFSIEELIQLPPQEIGSSLYDVFFQGTIAEQFASSLAIAKQGLRIRLHLDAVPQLTRLPWEYLYREGSDFFALSFRTPIVRYLHVQQPETLSTIADTFNILVILSSPVDLSPLDVEAEWQALEQEFAPLVNSQLTHIEQLRLIPGEDMWSSLRSRLRKSDLHAIHFVGHGDFQESDEWGVLCFEDEHRQTLPITANDFALLLKDYPIRLVYLNSCRSGLNGMSNPLAGIAQQLVRLNVPAVVATSMPISDRQGRRMAKEFYRALLQDGYPVDAALAEARKAIYHGDQNHEWGRSMLFMRSSDGRLFDTSQFRADKRYGIGITLSERQLCIRLVELIKQTSLGENSLKILVQESLPQGYAQPLLSTDMQIVIEQLWDIRDEQGKGKTIIAFAERLRHHSEGKGIDKLVQQWIEDALKNLELNMTEADYQQVIAALHAAQKTESSTRACHLMIRIMQHPSTKSEYQVDAWTQQSADKPEYFTGTVGDHNNRYEKTYRVDELPWRLFDILDNVGQQNIRPNIIEVFLPLQLFDQPVDQWAIEFEDAFGLQEILCREYHVVIRSSDRAFDWPVRTKLRWEDRWRILSERGCLLDDDRLFLDDDGLYDFENTFKDAIQRLYDDLISRRQTKRSVGFKHVPVNRNSAQSHMQAVVAILKAGVPILFWPSHCYSQQRLASEQENDMQQLEALVRAANRDNLPTLVSEKLRNADEARNVVSHIGNHLTLLYDDPTRIPELPQYIGNLL